MVIYAALIGGSVEEMMAAGREGKLGQVMDWAKGEALIGKVCF